MDYIHVTVTGTITNPGSVTNDFEVTYESPFPDPYVIELIKECGTLTITEAGTPTPPPTPTPTPSPTPSS